MNRSEVIERATTQAAISVFSNETHQMLVFLNEDIPALRSAIQGANLPERVYREFDRATTNLPGGAE